MLDQWIVRLVLSFIMRQLDKFTHTIDWTKVKADLAVRVRDVVPGAWFDDEAVAAANALVDAVAAALAKKDQIEEILALLAAQDYAGALLKLKDLVLGGWVPTTAAEHRAYAAFKAAA